MARMQRDIAVGLGSLTCIAAIVVLGGCIRYQPGENLASATARTAPDIRAADLKLQLEAFAHDSLLGRRAGSEGGARAERHLASEAARLALLPAGEDATYFQSVPLVRYALDDTATWLRVDTTALTIGDDFVPFAPAGIMRPLAGAQAVFGGRLGDSLALSAEQIAGRVVVLAPDADAPESFPDFSDGPLSHAAAVVVIGEGEFGGYVSFLKRSRTPYLKRNKPLPARILAAPHAAAALIGVPVDSTLPVGTAGRRMFGRIVFEETPLPSRNVMALLPGSDPRLRGEYVVLGAHADGLGTTRPLDHDSSRAFAVAEQALRRSLGDKPLSEEQRESIRINVDSLRQLRPARPDSVLNGADDNASGAVALLAIAEALSRSSARPRRSILFLWPTAEEIGLRGSTWFVERPTIPRDSIVAYINLDMIGRGGVQDTGGPASLEVIGAHQRSSALGALVEATNRALAEPFRLDYSRDGTEDGSLPFCRSDQFPFALHGIPVVFFTTGMHVDYHE
ncbi:MAG TPA: M20/M25/M40 family metallo-hydrolase, partial [Chloroflexota bacterium]|nr:M20/M25/M40 family metallo-hydrolase [Chloroflexota bacterium]